MKIVMTTTTLSITDTMMTTLNYDEDHDDNDADKCQYYFICFVLLYFVTVFYLSRRSRSSIMTCKSTVF